MVVTSHSERYRRPCIEVLYIFGEIDACQFLRFAEKVGAFVIFAPDTPEAYLFRFPYDNTDAPYTASEVIVRVEALRGNKP